MRLARTMLVVALALPSVLMAQSDSLRLGDRVRVRVASIRGGTSSFVGNLASLSHDTLIIALPGDRGSVTLPRSAVTEVAVSDGTRSHLWNLLPFVPAIVPAIRVATLPNLRGSEGVRFNIMRGMLFGFDAMLLGGAYSRTPAERWRPVYSWLEHSRP